MSSHKKTEKKTATSLLQEDIEKGIAEIKRRNLVLQKILNTVEGDKTSSASGSSSKSKQGKPK